MVSVWVDVLCEEVHGQIEEKARLDYVVEDLHASGWRVVETHEVYGGKAGEGDEQVNVYVVGRLRLRVFADYQVVEPRPLLLPGPVRLLTIRAAIAATRWSEPLLPVKTGFVLLTVLRLVQPENQSSALVLAMLGVLRVLLGDLRLEDARTQDAHGFFLVLRL